MKAIIKMIPVIVFLVLPYVLYFGFISEENVKAHSLIFIFGVVLFPLFPVMYSFFSAVKLGMTKSGGMILLAAILYVIDIVASVVIAIFNLNVKKTLIIYILYGLFCLLCSALMLSIYPQKNFKKIRPIE